MEMVAPLSKGYGKPKHSLSYSGRRSKCASALLAGSIVLLLAVSALASKTNPALVATVTVGEKPNGLAVTPDGSEVYVANSGSNTVSIISSPANSVVGTVAVGAKPMFVAISPDGSTAFVSNYGDDTVSVISTATKAVTQTIPAGKSPLGLAVTPDGSQLWVCDDGTVSIIDTATLAISNTITIPVGQRPLQLVFSPNGDKAHVLNQGDLAPTGTQVQGYVTQIDAVKQTILKEITFTQDNTAPFGIAVSGHFPQVLYISCLGSEGEILKVKDGATVTRTVFRYLHPNPGAYLAGIAGGGQTYFDRFLFIADLAGNKLLRFREKRDSNSNVAHRGVWLGKGNRPRYVAVSPVLDAGQVKYVYTSNSDGGTVSVINAENISP
jgi:YVTN family beta-propeller protein